MIAGRDRTGFSLVEMVAAVAIFSVSVVATLEVFTLCVRATTASLNHSRAALLAQGLLEETLAQEEVIPGSEQGDFGEAFLNATWTLDVLETETEGLYEAQAVVSWPERGKDKTFALTTLMAER